MRCLFYLLLFILPLVAFAQRDELPTTIYENEQGENKNIQQLPVHAIAFSGGISFAQGNYDTKEYARTGISLDIDISYRLYRNWCAGLTIKGFNNSVEENATHIHTIPLLLNTAPETSFVYTADNSNYAYNHLLAAIGGGMSFVEKKTTFDMRLMGGVLYTLAQSQQLSGTYQTNGNTYHFDFLQDNPAVISPALYISLDLSIPIAHRWGVYIKGDYLSAATNTEKTYEISNENYHLQSTDNISRNVQTFGLNVGMKYNWGRTKTLK